MKNTWTFAVFILLIFICLVESEYQNEDHQLNYSEHVEISTTDIIVTSENIDFETEEISLEGNNDIKVMIEVSHKSIPKNGDGDKSVQHHPASKDSNETGIGGLMKHLVFTTWIMSICLMIIMIGMFWLILRKKITNSHFRVSYYQKGNETPNVAQKFIPSANFV